MTRKVVQQRSSAARKAALRTAAALTAGLALVAGAAGTGQAAGAAPAGGGAQAGASCGEAAPQAAPAAPAKAAAPEAAPAPAATGTASQKISYGVDSQLPIGLWSSAGVTLRTPVSQGKVRLDVKTAGFSTASLVVQRYEPRTHRWIDLDASTGGGSWPDRGVYTFPVTAADASPRHPRTVALRLQDLDRPGTVTVAASVSDGRGHTYRAPARTTTATRPQVTVDGWRRGTTLERGGAPRPLTVTVKNTTNRAYPALTASYYAYGAGKSRALVPKDVTLRQYRPGKGWVRVPLLAGGCDPGMSTTLPPVAKGPLAPGATAVYRLDLAVAGSAPRDVTSADAGVTVANGDQSFFSAQLPFAIRGGARQDHKPKAEQER
ncbi:hypothetical protein BLA24_11605 [Streptomyces cinnamoneus]|uniref:Uncharacterized protein n=1 Tax=Streptomyces cinnamoneus TaxID=53446 RepID=A0A2G1XKG5_STRCJ|nr:hypothetical protein [Streptomyces cinnamoneus]PHQ51728.1 hypothetical protein BLA24_11605 [Streptomyces cinnamoneus]